ERVDLGYSLACDFAAIFQLPGWPCGVLADDFVVPIFQFGIRALERPSELAVGAGLATVDLRSRTMREQNWLQACGHSDRIRHIGRSFFCKSIFLRGGLSVGERGDKNEHGQADDRRGEQ